AHIQVYSASAHGTQFSASHDVPLFSAESFRATVAESDVIISCTSRDGFALVPDDLELAAPQPRLVIDLGLPRNVDPAVAEIPRVELLDLETIRVHAPIDEFAHLEAAHDIVRTAAKKYGTSERSRELAPAITTVRELLNATVERELALVKSSDPLVRAEVEHALRHASAMLLHQLTQAGHDSATHGAAHEWVHAVERVFGVKV
ncbi:MAG: glutamyl-tRNA reductase, partial [Agromyces sp.]